jgi:gamma-glutamyltranspeptidase
MIQQLQKERRGVMPEYFTTGRPAVMGTQGAVASPHYLASEAGLMMLRQGGHAVDAVIAMNAVLSVVYNHMAGLGGDMFCQVWDSRSGTVKALNGSGRSGERVTRELYTNRGMDKIPQRGPLAANTVPGVVDAWSSLHQRYGRLNWSVLFEPAIFYAMEGFPISQKFRDFIEEHASTLREFETTARVYLSNGNPPVKGQVLKQSDLASSLRTIAMEGSESFYKGELAKRIVRGLQNAGGVLTEADFANHRSEWVDPISTTYRGYTVTQLPPNTQGLTTLVLLNILEQYDLNEIGDNTADFYHLMAEAAKLAFVPRDKWVSDPDFMDIPVKKIISKDYASHLSEELDMKRARSESEIQESVSDLEGGGDTTYMCASDVDGNVCSLIQSVYFEFGSAFMPENTGVLMQNRGSFFKLDPENPNVVEPRKRVFHTIIPAMAFKNDRPFMAFGTMGGEGQPQTQAAMLSRVVDFGYDIQQAIEAPRWLYGRTWGEESRTLKLESRIPDSVSTELKRRGHEVEMMEQWSQKMGHAQGILLDSETGVMMAGADPRGDGLALSI